MNEYIIREDFDRATYDKRLQWYCPPAHWSIKDSQLVVETLANTDYWQKTHYGFVVDNGHFLYLPLSGDFTLSTRVRFFPVHQFDQAGLMVRYTSSYWLKTSVEYEPDAPACLGAVVTNHGYSDWSTQNFTAESNEIALRIRRNGDDFAVEFAYITTHRGEPEAWTQMRMAHLHQPDNAILIGGIYACSPKEAGFKTEFDYLIVEKGS
jgi:uncharacterized protein